MSKSSSVESPAPPPENPVVSTASWAATVLGGIFGGIALFLPGPMKEFMLAHPLWGWGGVVLLLIAYRPITLWHLRSMENRQSKIWGMKVMALSTHWAGEETNLAKRYEEKEAELSRKDRERDLPLLEERLVDWELNGELHSFLTREVLHYLLPSDFVYGLERRMDEWLRDPREFSDPDISMVWDSFLASARAYVDKISEYMWENHKADFLQVPPEWKDKDPERYRRAFQELEEHRNAISKALTEVYRIQHSKVANLSHDLK